jgi:hypothetical protein
MKHESTQEYRSDQTGASVLELCLTREDSAGLIFISSQERPDLFIAIKDESDLRPAVEKCLKNAYAGQANRVQVYVNGKIDGPQIGVMVKLAS